MVSRVSKVYEPSDDSYLLSKTLEKEIPKFNGYENKKYLEIGCGSGIQLETLYNIGINKNNIFSLDINPEAVQKCKDMGFNSIISDLFSEIPKNKKYNIIIFNPPYLPDSKDNPEPEDSKIMTTGGGNGGSEIINKFLKQSKKHLNEKGKIFLLTSSLTKNIDWNNFKKEKINKKNLFFERLYVWKLTLK